MACGRGKHPHGDLCTDDLLGRVAPGWRESLQGLARLRIGIAFHRVAVTVRHHHEQTTAIHESELEPEELGVVLGLPVEREGGAKVGRGQDHRHSDPKVRALGRTQERIESLDLGPVDLRGER